MTGKYVKKIVRERYADGKEIDTTVYNYGCVVTTNQRERELFEGILDTAKETGAVLETLWKFAVVLKTWPYPNPLTERLHDKSYLSQVDLSDYLPGLKGRTQFDPDSLRKLRKLMGFVAQIRLAQRRTCRSGSLNG